MLAAATAARRSGSLHGPNIWTNPKALGTSARTSDPNPSQELVLGPSLRRHVLGHFSTILFLCRLLCSQFWCHTQSLPCPFAASFVTVAHFYAFWALSKPLGCRRCSNTPQQPQNRLIKCVYAPQPVPWQNQKNAVWAIFHSLLNCKGFVRHGGR